MDQQRGRRRRTIARVVLVGVAGLFVVLAGQATTAPPIPSPQLELASTEDPAPPTDVRITPGNGEFTRVTWTASTESKTSGYQVYLGSDLKQTVTGTETTAAITGLTNGTDYTVRVVTRTSSGVFNLTTHYGSTAATATSYPRDGVAPARPTGVTAVRGERQVQVSWSANGESDLAGYRVLRDGTVVSGTLTGRSYTDTGLTNDTTYRYTVQAVDVSRQWSASSSPEVRATPTDLTAPATPVSFLAERGDRQVTLSWRANGETDLASYRVLRDGVEVAVVAGSALGWTDTGLTNDRTYRYALVAVDGHGNRSGSTAPVNSTPTDLTPPAVPTGLAAARGEHQVTLSWTANAEADLAFYVLLRDGAETATLTGTSYVDTGLTNDQVYAYRVVAVDGHGNRSAGSAEVSATPTDLTAPATPTGFTAVRGDGRVDLSWTANGEADLASYRLYRDGMLLRTTTATSWADTGLTNDTTYTYRLVAVDTHGNVSTATPDVTATPTDLTPPAVPTGLVGQGLDGRIRIDWDLGTEADLDWYQVWRDGQFLAWADAVAGYHSFEEPSAVDVDHDYQVLAIDTHGNTSALSAAVRVRALDLTAPATPVGFGAVHGDGRVDLSWTANGESDLASYRVLRGGVEVATLIGATSYADTGLTNDTAYTYRLVAVDTHGNRSVTTDPVTATPTDLTAPATPAGFGAVRGDGRVDLSWTANGESDLASYRVLRDGVEIGTVTGSTSWADTTVVNDRTYAYALVAVDTHGNRSTAATASATPTDLTPPGAPTGPVATAGERQVQLTWTAATAPDVVGYRVLRAGTQVAASTGPAATVTGLAPGVAVTLVVVAVDGHGNISPPSTEVTSTPFDRTAPAAPTAPTGVPGSGSATVGWTAPADPDALVFRVLRDGVLVATVPAGPVTVTGLTDGTSYTFTVVAVDPSGNVSPASAAVVVVPVAGTVPAQGSGQSGGLAVSGDGRFVVVATSARLDPADTNTAPELYRIDRVAGTATRIAPLGAAATAADATNSAAPAISDDGRYVALATTAKLVATDTNGLADVYRLDTTTGLWSLVSVPLNGRVTGTPGTELQTGSAVNATSPSVVLSADGDLVLFYSARSDLGPADTNGVVDVYAKRMSTGAVTRVSAAPGGRDLSRAATGPALALTPDGRYALFPATGPNGPMVLLRAALAGPDAGQVVVVSTMTVGGRTSEVGVYRDAGDVDLSDDGRYVAFVTSARPTAPGQTWTTGLAYRADTATGTVVPLGDGQTTAWEHQVALDPTGRYGFFSTTAALTPGDTDGHTDVHRRDLDTGALTLVTAGASGQQVSGPTGSVGPAEYGRVVAVSGDLVVLATSEALLPGDTNRLRDVYAKDLATGAVRSVVA